LRKRRVDALTLKSGPTISGVTVSQEGARTVHEVTDIAPTLAITLEFPERRGTSRPSEFPEGTEINASVRNPYRDESSPNYIPEGTAVNLYVHRLQPDEDPDDDNLLFQVEGSMGSDGLAKLGMKIEG